MQGDLGGVQHAEAGLLVSKEGTRPDWGQTFSAFWQMFQIAKIEYQTLVIASRMHA